jgi:acetyl esterase/lipase
VILPIFSTSPQPADERIPYGPDPLQFGDLRLPAGPGPHPVVVVVHGGFWRARWDLEHIGHACDALTRQTKVATWCIEYRRIGNEGGGWPGTFLDVGAATDFLREIAPAHNLDLNHVVTIGHSAGGHLAVWLAARQYIPKDDPLHTDSPLALKSAISLAGVLDLHRAWELRLSNNVVVDLMGGTPGEVPERYAAASPIEMLPLGVKQVLIHGTRDEDVPYEISRRYHAEAVKCGDQCDLITLPGTGHFGLIDPSSREWRKVVEAVSSVVGGR